MKKCIGNAPKAKKLNAKVEFMLLTKIMIDYEKATINAIKTEFPSTKVNWFFFHLSQCMWRHVQEFGLQKKYNEDPEYLHCI